MRLYSLLSDFSILDYIRTLEKSILELSMSIAKDECILQPLLFNMVETHTDAVFTYQHQDLLSLNQNPVITKYRFLSEDVIKGVISTKFKYYWIKQMSSFSGYSQEDIEHIYPHFTFPLDFVVICDALLSNIASAAAYAITEDKTFFEFHVQCHLPNPKSQLSDPAAFDDLFSDSDSEKNYIAI